VGKIRKSTPLQRYFFARNLTDGRFTAIIEYHGKMGLNIRFAMVLSAFMPKTIFQLSDEDRD
jgi:hypothetical protein